MDLDELVETVKKLLKNMKKISCENCKYRKFSKELDDLCLSVDTIRLLKEEIENQKNYEDKKWTKIFKPAMLYIASPMYAAFMANYISKIDMNNNFWNSLLCLTVLFVICYILFGGFFAIIFIISDTKKNSNSLLLRFLDKYIHQKRLNQLITQNIKTVV